MSTSEIKLQYQGYNYKSQTDLIMFKELEQERGNSCSDAYEKVDDYEEHVGRTGHLEPEGCWVHDGSDGPPGRKSTESLRMSKALEQEREKETVVLLLTFLRLYQKQDAIIYIQVVRAL